MKLKDLQALMKNHKAELKELKSSTDDNKFDKVLTEMNIQSLEGKIKVLKNMIKQGKEQGYFTCNDGSKIIID